MSTGFIIDQDKLKSFSAPSEITDFTDAGQAGWTIQTHNAVGIDYVMLCAGEGADVFPLHKDTAEWFGYVVEGSGELHLGDETNVTETISYKAGDVLVFKSETYHGWKSTSETSKLMFVKPSE